MPCFLHTGIAPSLEVDHPLFSIALLLLMFLLWQGHAACVRTLLLTGANRDARRGLDAATPLHQVIFVRFLRTAAILRVHHKVSVCAQTRISKGN